ncbi:MAG: hypothetical protein AAB740_01420 [Patescibacteria group bacterium]
MKTFIFKVNLLDDKKIVREIEVLESANLYKLAEAIVSAFDFDFDHAFGFFSEITADWRLTESEKMYELFADMKDQGIEPTGAKSVVKTKISEVWKTVGDKMMMLFDYGDDWRFVVELVGFGEKSPKTKYPRVTKSTGKAPEQYPPCE